MKVLIVGGGIGGLTLSAFLKKKGIESVIAEKTKKWKTVGYVLGLYPNGMKILNSLGLQKVLKKEALDMKGYTIKDGDGKVLWEIDFDSWRKKYGPLVLLERDRLHRMLIGLNKKIEIRMNTTITSIKKGKEILVKFSGGKQEYFDLVVGADGINSRIRDYVQPGSKKTSAGFSFWVMWIPRVFKFPENIVYYFGRGKLFSIFPVKSKKHAAVAFAMPKKSIKDFNPNKKANFIKKNFSDMRGVVPKILNNLPKDEEIFYHEIEEIGIKNWGKGNVVLLGDAVHPISPILGMGASMAMEDAYVLADELSKNQSIDLAIEKYVNRRKSRVLFLQKKSRDAHRILSIGGWFYRIRNFMLKHGYSKKYYKSLDKFLGERV